MFTKKGCSNIWQTITADGPNHKHNDIVYVDKKDYIVFFVQGHFKPTTLSENLLQLCHHCQFRVQRELVWLRPGTGEPWSHSMGVEVGVVHQRRQVEGRRGQEEQAHWFYHPPLSQSGPYQWQPLRKLGEDWDQEGAHQGQAWVRLYEWQFVWAVQAGRQHKMSAGQCLLDHTPSALEPLWLWKRGDRGRKGEGRKDKQLLQLLHISTSELD